ncbi:hypothetical protein A9K55_006960 [Cordyceps militaris]|uniref:Uncharacterized protein n=1 Tax=Cordyceps militaris TaxID=73501 RepID=A0A2H4SHI1_CORMI|nr:hypothetical protein A9K55_006960 [Cordyceps militaris]
MPSKVLHSLTAGSVMERLDTTHAITGTNSRVQTPVWVDEWFDWKDFTYDNIKRIYHDQLNRLSIGDSHESEILEHDRIVFNEASVDDLLRKFPVSVVNWALHSATSQNETPHFGRGSRCPAILWQHARYIPDWSVIVTERVNVLPGDSKISSKWWPEMLNNESYHVEWTNVVSQVATYMAACSSRYGFIVTDREVVVLRITRQAVGPGLATSRSPRRITRRNIMSDSSVAASSSSPRIPSSQDYVDDNPLNWDYWTIHWQKSYRSGDKLTPQLALWALAMMASHGDNHIDYSYPGLDTWRAEGLKRFVHNTSGEVVTEKRTKMVFEGSSPFSAGVGTAQGTNTAAAAEDDIYSDDRQGASVTSHVDMHMHDDGYAEPELPQLRSSALAETSPSFYGEWVEVEVRKKGDLYEYRAKGAKKDRKSSARGDWVQVEGGAFALQGRKHTYYTQNFPKS